MKMRSFLYLVLKHTIFRKPNTRRKHNTQSIVRVFQFVVVFFFFFF